MPSLATIFFVDHDKMFISYYTVIDKNILWYITLYIIHSTMDCIEITLICGFVKWTLRFNKSQQFTI